MPILSGFLEEKDCKMFANNHFFCIFVSSNLTKISKIIKFAFEIIVRTKQKCQLIKDIWDRCESAQSQKDVNPNTTFYSYYFFPRAPRRESRCFFYALTLNRKGKLNPISLYCCKICDQYGFLSDDEERRLRSFLASSCSSS